MLGIRRISRLQFSQLFFLVFGGFLLSFWGAISSASPQTDLPALIKKVEPSIVVIMTFNQTGKQVGQGTGFIFAKNGDVISNHHVLQGASRSRIKLSSGEEFAV